MSTRNEFSEHMKWCKKRALELAEKGNLSDAVASMISDLGKNEQTKHIRDTAQMLFPIVLQDILHKNKEAVIKWINDFAD